jgi:hypothetical protein
MSPENRRTLGRHEQKDAEEAKPTTKGDHRRRPPSRRCVPCALGRDGRPVGPHEQRLFGRLSYVPCWTTLELPAIREPIPSPRVARSFTGWDTSNSRLAGSPRENSSTSGVDVQQCTPGSPPGKRLLCLHLTYWSLPSEMR